MFRRELAVKTGQGGHDVRLELKAEEAEDIRDQSRLREGRRMKV